MRKRNAPPHSVIRRRVQPLVPEHIEAWREREAVARAAIDAWGRLYGVSALYTNVLEATAVMRGGFSLNGSPVPPEPPILPFEAPTPFYEPFDAHLHVCDHCWQTPPFVGSAGGMDVCGCLYCINAFFEHCGPDVECSIARTFSPLSYVHVTRCAVMQFDIFIGSHGRWQ